MAKPVKHMPLTASPGGAKNSMRNIALHQAAKKYFDDLGCGRDKKLPTISSLKQEYAALLAEKRKLYSGYRELKETSRALTIAKGNADRILEIKPQAQNRNTSRENNQRNAHHR